MCGVGAQYGVSQVALNTKTPPCNFQGTERDPQSRGVAFDAENGGETDRQTDSGRAREKALAAPSGRM